MLLASSQLIFCFLLIFLAFRVILYRIAFLIVVRVLLNRKPMKSSARPISLVTIFFFPCLSIVSTSYSFDNGKICFVSFMIRPSFSSQNASILSSATFRSLLFAPKHTISSTYRTPYFTPQAYFGTFPAVFPFLFVLAIYCAVFFSFSGFQISCFM